MDADQTEPDRTLAHLTLANRLQLAQAIARLVRAHLPLDKALVSLADQADSTFADSIQVVSQKLERGHSLVNSLAPGTDNVSRGLAASIELGQQSGSLDQALEQWVAYHLTMQRHRRRLVSAMVYPVLLVGVALIAILFSAWQLLPQYREAFFQLSRVQPPWLSVLDFIHRHYWWLASIAVLSLFSLAWWVTKPRRGVDSSGVPRNQALKNLHYCRVAQLSALAVRSGQPISACISLILSGVGLRQPATPNFEATDQWRHCLGKETCGVLTGLEAHQINPSSAESLLQTISQNFAELSEIACERDVQWLPVFTSICVGLATVVTYVGLIYLPWVALFYEIASHG